METPWLDKCPAPETQEELAAKMELRGNERPTDKEFSEVLAFCLRRLAVLLEHMAEELLDPASNDVSTERFIRVGLHYLQLEDVSSKATDLIARHVQVAPEFEVVDVLMYDATTDTLHRL